MAQYGPAFRGGWAVIPFNHTPHYWRFVNATTEDAMYLGKRQMIRFRNFRSLCGVYARTYRGVPAMQPGENKCKRCQRAAK